ncbi:sugar phosphate isomerase/epimerase family protein [Microbacterium ulmi]|uniref:Sugar phosphate isomerase/epimerase n=1 Tax=Microbacterium ulmi TaxID=179095 RepID=A0A7Y2M017_9MICO|nr:sugar phosphate isomerase/epimerase [Microbacterium ulmi]NII69368.1 sugar phosphate isomerase/epimerase [Microbacterium ulmi]NNH04020.1 sugar phosphate isomerase/epimerase [Microbacterium ulmi]
MAQSVALLATCWTTAGSAGPLIDNDFSEFSLLERISAAAEAGYTGFGLLLEDLQVAEKTVGWTQVRDHLRSSGIEHIEIEMLNDWFRSGPERVKSDQDRRYLLRAARFFRPRHVKVGGSIDLSERFSPELYGRALSWVCDDFAEVGCAVAFELMPHGVVDTIEKGVAMIDVANRPNAGLMLDLWHLTRSPSTIGDIAALPGHYITGVELDDGPLEPVRGDDLLYETLHDRKLPGEGEMDVAGFVAAVRATGFNGPWGVEMISDEHRRRGLAEQARESFRTARSFL